MDLKPNTKARFGNELDRVKRVPFGLGSAPSQDALNKTLRCSFGNVPVIEQVVWTIPLPLLDTEAQNTFGDVINVLTNQNNVPGVASIDSTFLLNGVLQTDLYTLGVGVHVFCEPMNLSTIGNAFKTPTSQVQAPPSPDVWSVNDINNGALGSGVTIAAGNFFPADFDWGGEVWRAGWNFINAYQFQWRTSQRELVLNELAADVSYMASFADWEGSGTSEFPVAEPVAITNALYRSKVMGFIFLPANFRRVGSVSTSVPPITLTGNTGIFHPTRDFDLAPVTWGGPKWQGYGCKGQMYRLIENPCYLERGIPIGMQFIAQDPVHQAQMLEALTFDNNGALNLAFGQNINPDTNIIGCGTGGGTTGGGTTTVMLEQTLDSTPALVPQQVFVCRQVFKGGTLKIGIKLKGWEFPAPWRLWCQANAPQMISCPAQG